MIDTLFNIGFKSFFTLIGLGVVIFGVIILLILIFVPFSFLPSLGKLSKEDKKTFTFFAGLIVYYLFLTNKIFPFEYSTFLFVCFCVYLYELYRKDVIMNILSIGWKSLSRTLRLILISILIFTSIPLIILTIDYLIKLFAGV